MKEREAFRVRFPAGLLAEVRKHKSQEEPLNEIVVRALDKEVSYRRGLATHHRIVLRREEIRKKNRNPA